MQNLNPSSNEALQKLRISIFEVLIMDEISVTEERISSESKLSLELIKCNKLPFGGMPEMVTVNF